MAPASGPAGSGKKNAGLSKQSRNSTPAPAPAALPPQEFYDPDYLNTRVILFIRNLSFEDIVDQGASSATVPDLKSLDATLEKLKSLSSIMEKRSTFYDRGMRHLADERKKRPDSYDQMRIDGDHEPKKSKHKRKRAPDAADNVPHERSSPLHDAKPRTSAGEGSASSSLSPVAIQTPTLADADKLRNKDRKEQESSSDDDGAPPRREMPQSQTFGSDPSTFPDPTIYEILPIKPGMSDQEKKEIYSVASYPRTDLRGMIAGDPPDKDFSSAKPTSQINFSTFSSYLDPYFRPFSEEDLAFLRERGDRVTPFVMPKRGKRHYTEIWAEEDGAMAADAQPQGHDGVAPNQPRGSIEQMNDNVGETDSLSVGPLASRLLQMLRPENRGQPAEERSGTNGFAHGDIGMNGDAVGDEQQQQQQPGVEQLPPATHMLESSSEAWKKASHPKLDYAQVDERLKQELMHIGFLPPQGYDADYDSHYDDEVAARLRLLQGKLKDQILINGARKARLTDVVRERMAHQEYQTILEDLDSQVQAAYLKRTRTMGKSKKSKRPGGSGAGSHFVGGAAGTARPGIGDLTKTLMERRRRWIGTIGSVFDDESLSTVPRAADANSSIFKPDEMAQLIKKEKEQWDDEVDEE